jgi:hypothetical protein
LEKEPERKIKYQNAKGKTTYYNLKRMNPAKAQRREGEKVKEYGM